MLANKLKTVSMIIWMGLVCLCVDSNGQSTGGLDYDVMPLKDTGVTKRHYDHSKTPRSKLAEITQRGKEDADYNDVNQPSYTKLDEAGNDLPANAETWALVRDNVTGRIWEAKADDGSIHDKDNLYTYTEAETYVEALNRIKYGGRDNWRIPNLKELASIIDFSKNLPAVNTGYFPDQHPSFYWSSTVCLDDPDFVWGVMFHSGQEINHYKRIRFFLRAVCVDDQGMDLITAYSDPNVRFEDNGNGTITDHATGLMWMKSFVVKSKGEKKQVKFRWEDALAYGEEAVYAGYDDWRLPDINELISIVDYSRNNPAIYPVFGSDIGDDCFFSSTYQQKHGSQFVILFKYGITNILGMESYLRFVRTVQAE